MTAPKRYFHSGKFMSHANEIHFGTIKNKYYLSVSGAMNVMQVIIPDKRLSPHVCIISMLVHIKLRKHIILPFS